MAPEEIKRMDIKEFREQGFLQEANRLFFHPLGLALEATIEWPDDVTEEEKKKYIKETNHPRAKWVLGGVWDYRDDPEGMLFGKDMIDKDKIRRIEELRKSKLQHRIGTGECYENGIQKVPA